MQIHEFPLQPPLSRYVQTIWSLELENPWEFGGVERIVPDGIVEVVFHFREPFLWGYTEGSFARQPTSFAISQTRDSIQIKPAGNSGFVSIRFFPWGAHHFFPTPMRDFANQIVPAADLWGSSAKVLEEQIAQARDNPTRAALVERFLLAQLEEHHKQEVGSYLKFLWRHKGQVRIGQMARQMGTTDRQLQRTFMNGFGTSPKQMARIVRFLYACRLLREESDSSLTEIAYRAGYYDQSHFNHEFKSFSGLTPGQFVGTTKVSFLTIG